MTKTTTMRRARVLTTRGAVLAAALLLPAFGTGLTAQIGDVSGPDRIRAERVRAGARPIRGPEALLAMRDRLELTDAQLRELERLRDRSRAEGDALVDARIRLRRDVRDGDLTLAEARERARDLSSRARALREEIADGTRATLDETQTARLMRMRIALRGRMERLDRRDARRPEGRGAPAGTRERRAPRGPGGGN